jgi:hypothetical protein
MIGFGSRQRENMADGRCTRVMSSVREADFGPGHSFALLCTKSASTHPVSEPGAVATGPNFDGRAMLLSLSAIQVEFRAGRYHHPTRAARAGTPVRSRF